MAIETGVAISDAWFREMDRFTDIVQPNYEPDGSIKHQRVKVAIIDSGISPKHPHSHLIQEFKDFVDPGNKELVDEHPTRHGSTGVELLVKISPEADIYTARVFKDVLADEKTQELAAEVRYFLPMLLGVGIGLAGGNMLVIWEAIH
ncbi:hypothetical protein ABW20_dc0104105 [Dactylellina cionopaga]|nr:hypothetical protein ABW20_dc0104105 [Dactylellina cionopaga]